MTMRMGTWLVVGTVALAAPACGDDESTADDAGSTGQADDGTTTAATSTSAGDAGSTGAGGGSSTGQGSCEDLPSRLIIAGDSIFACFGVGGAEGQNCGPRQLGDYVRETYAADLTYENFAQNGAITDEVPGQLDAVPVGMPGHALISIYVGGNDLLGLLQQPDAAAQTAFDNELVPTVQASWAAVFAFADDPANFPDGATVLMNNQYNPFDDCTEAPFGAFITELKIGLLAEYNDLLAQIAADHPNAAIADQHGPFLGHGHQYQNAMCPFFVDGSAYWMQGGADLIHPNGEGHTNIADQLGVVADDLYGACP